jgi:hypothetical protein
VKSQDSFLHVGIDLFGKMKTLALQERLHGSVFREAEGVHDLQFFVCREFQEPPHQKRPDATALECIADDSGEFGLDSAARLNQAGDAHDAIFGFSVHGHSD